MKNIFKLEKTILQITFNPGLTLTGFRTTRPRCVATEIVASNVAELAFFQLVYTTRNIARNNLNVHLPFHKLYVKSRKYLFGNSNKNFTQRCFYVSIGKIAALARLVGNTFFKWNFAELDRFWP